MRYFELNNGDDSKFWNVEIENDLVIKTYGKKGSKGREVRDEYTTAEFAKKDVLKLIGKRFKEGYVELPGGDGDHEKWIDPNAKPPKPAKAAGGGAPAKTKEKRTPIPLEFIKTGFELQPDLSAEALFGDLHITGKFDLPGNMVAGPGEVNNGLSYHEDGYLIALSESWSEVTDLFDLRNGTCCRIPSADPERRIMGLLTDMNYLYALAIKGFESESRNLVKYDLDTKETVWSCGSSASSILPRFVQDGEYIYGCDVKMLYVISKTLGKTVAKVEVARKMDHRQKFYANAGKRFVSLHEIAGRNMVLCGSLVNIALIDPVNSAVVWNRNCKKEWEIIACGSFDGKLFVLGKDCDLTVINIPDGKILFEGILDLGFVPGRGIDFRRDGEGIYSILRTKDGGRFMLSVNTEDFTFVVDEYTGKLPEGGMYDPSEVVKDGLIVSATGKTLTVTRKGSGEAVSSLELPGSPKGWIVAFTVVGNCIYAVVNERRDDPSPSVIYQVM